MLLNITEKLLPCEAFNKAMGVHILADLQENPNVEISKKAVTLIDAHFSDEIITDNKENQVTHF